MIKKLSRRKSQDIDADTDPSATPITNYKNRRKLMQENKIKAKEKERKIEAGEDPEEDVSSPQQHSASSSFIGSVTSSFSKKGSKRAQIDSENNDLSSGFLNSLGFSQNE